MSYILDALRKADAERERDPARGIHANPAAAVPARAGFRLPGWAWPASSLLIAGAAGFALWQRQAPPPAPAAPAVAAAAIPAPLAPATVAVATTVLPAPALPAPMPAAAPSKPLLVVKAAPAAPVARVLAPATPGPLAAAKLPATTTNAVASAAPSTAAASATNPPLAANTPAADRVYAVSELPADVQRELPKLAIAGGVYSENPGQRMLIVGGQVMNEGAELAPGVVLDQIRARAAVLRYRNWRYSVGY